MLHGSKGSLRIRFFLLPFASRYPPGHPGPLKLPIQPLIMQCNAKNQFSPHGHERDVNIMAQPIQRLVLRFQLSNSQSWQRRLGSQPEEKYRPHYTWMVYRIRVRGSSILVTGVFIWQPSTSSKVAQVSLNAFLAMSEWGRFHHAIVLDECELSAPGIQSHRHCKAQPA
jgi:hypothetical protein